MRVATFNVQNLRLRADRIPPHLDGARDRDAPGETGPEAEALDGLDRTLTARLIADAGADVLALQEVFDQATLDHFCERWLAPLGARYPHRRCLPGNDGHGEDVAILSRLPLDEVHSHAALRYGDIGATPPPGVAPTGRVFRRDCLAVRCGELWFFVCHWKAAFAGDERSRLVRRAEALAVRRVIEGHVGDPRRASFLALGDFNVHGPETAAALRVLTDELAVDLSERAPPDERWTYYLPDEQRVSCPDRVLASPAVAARFPSASPRVLRAGLGHIAGGRAGPRYAEVGERRPRASDHALVLVDLA